MKEGQGLDGQLYYKKGGYSLIVLHMWHLEIQWGVLGYIARVLKEILVFSYRETEKKARLKN